ncbi:VanW like protein [Orenia metallireducens]|uniref:VanW like protein n=1 Tax=Orenia metallireducens TaxID=1413210 RepID=A0A285FND7_9FIRM|nr:VanW family protein [Orenia metallireducens]PRX33606.1 VanW like protein [Orenia metallireducens]SNY11836.1 VanW like protein [Orenia metallireducens]
MDKKEGTLHHLQKGIIILSIIILVVILLLGLVAEVDRFIRVIWGVEKGVIWQKQELSGYLKKEVESLIYYYSKDHIVYPVAATIDPKSGKILSEVNGEIIDITANLESIFNAEENTELKAIKYRINPNLYQEDLEKITKVIGTYKTIITGRKERRENIRIAAEFINNQIILAGDIFSFNEVVGPRTKKRGFKEAPEIINGELSLGVGGGICQVSSTLFNALKADRFQIIERHTHSRDISYVPDGKDATVAWEYLDFKFKNNFAKPIIIKVEIVGNQLIIKILGSSELN